MNHFAVERIALSTALGWALVTSSLAQIAPSLPSERARTTALHESSAEIVVLPKIAGETVVVLRKQSQDKTEAPNQLETWNGPDHIVLMSTTTSREIRLASRPRMVVKLA